MCQGFTSRKAMKLRIFCRGPHSISGENKSMNLYVYHGMFAPIALLPNSSNVLQTRLLAPRPRELGEIPRILHRIRCREEILRYDLGHCHL